MSWARLIKRVFGIDMAQCPLCGNTLKIIAAIEHPPVIAKIPTHLGHSIDFGLIPNRYPLPSGSAS